MISTKNKNLFEILQIKQELLKKDLKTTENLIQQIQKGDSVIEVEKRKSNLSNSIKLLGTKIEQLDKIKIFILDSNDNTSKMVQNYFIKYGFDCERSNDEQNASSLIKSEKFNVVLLDHKFIDIIDKLNGTKIIVWSTLDLPQSEIDDLLKRGVYSYLKKPVSPEILLRTIET